MFIKILLIIIFLLAISYIGISVYIATALTKPVPSPVVEDPHIVSENVEDISFTTSDNFYLKGWFFQNPSSQKIIIFVAGTNNNRADKAYGTLSIAALLYKKGYSIMLFDRRTTGESDGKRITFGLPEAQDVIAAVTFAHDRGFEEKNVGIIADSLGAIATLMGIDSLQNVGAIVLDSTAARIKPVVENILSREQHIPAFLFPGIFLSANMLYGIDLNVINPIDKMPLAQNREFLFLHGEKDTVIPVENSKELLSKSSSVSKLVIFPGVNHAQTFKTDPDLYEKEVFSFLDRKLGN